MSSSSSSSPSDSDYEGENQEKSLQIEVEVDEDLLTNGEEFVLTSPTAKGFKFASCATCIGLYEEYSQSLLKLRDLQAALRREKALLKKEYQNLISCEPNLQIEAFKNEEIKNDLASSPSKKRKVQNRNRKEIFKELDKFIEAERTNREQPNNIRGIFPFIEKAQRAYTGKNAEFRRINGNFSKRTFLSEPYRFTDPIGDAIYADGLYPNLFEIWQELEALEVVSSVNLTLGVSQISETRQQKRSFDFVRSPLLWFRAYRVHDHFQSIHGFQKSSNTFSHAINPFIPICKYSLSGTCRDSKCGFQHSDAFRVSEADLRRDLASYGAHRQRMYSQKRKKILEVQSLTDADHFFTLTNSNNIRSWPRNNLKFDGCHRSLAKCKKNRNITLIVKHDHHIPESNHEEDGFIPLNNSSDASDDELESFDDDDDDRYYDSFRDTMSQVDQKDIENLTDTVSAEELKEKLFPNDPLILEHPFPPSALWVEKHDYSVSEEALEILAHKMYSEATEEEWLLYLKLLIARRVCAHDVSNEEIKHVHEAFVQALLAFSTSNLIWTLYRIVSPQLFRPFAVPAKPVNPRLRFDLKYLYFTIMSSCNLRLVNMVNAIYTLGAMTFGKLIQTRQDDNVSKIETRQRGVSHLSALQNAFFLKNTSSSSIFCRVFASTDAECLREILDDSGIVVSSTKAKPFGLRSGDKVFQINNSDWDQKTLLQNSSEVLVCLFERSCNDTSTLEFTYINEFAEEIERRIIREIYWVILYFGGSCKFSDIKSLLCDADLVEVRRGLPRANAIDYATAHAIFLTDSGFSRAKPLCLKSRPGFRYDLLREKIEPLWQLLQPWCPSQFSVSYDGGEWSVLTKKQNVQVLEMNIPPLTPIIHSLIPVELLSMTARNPQSDEGSAFEHLYGEGILQYANFMLVSGYGRLLEEEGESIEKCKLLLGLLFPHFTVVKVGDDYARTSILLAKMYVLIFGHMPSFFVACFGSRPKNIVPILDWTSSRKTEILREKMGFALSRLKKLLFSINLEAESLLEPVLINLLLLGVESTGKTFANTLIRDAQTIIAKFPYPMFWRKYAEITEDEDFRIFFEIPLQKFPNNSFLHWIVVSDSLIKQNRPAAQRCLKLFLSAYDRKGKSRAEFLKNEISVSISENKHGNSTVNLYTMLLFMIALVVLENDHGTHRNAFRQLAKDEAIDEAISLCILGCLRETNLNVKILRRFATTKRHKNLVYRWRYLRRVEDALGTKEYWQRRCSMTKRGSKILDEPGLALRAATESFLLPGANKTIAMKGLKLYPFYSFHLNELWSLMVLVQLARADQNGAHLSLLMSVDQSLIDFRKWTELFYFYTLHVLRLRTDNMSSINTSFQSSGVDYIAVCMKLRQLFA